MPEPSVLEVIAALGVLGTAGIVGLAATAGVSVLMVNTLELYTKRKIDYLYLTGRSAGLKEPSLSLYRAFRDAYKFEKAYILSLGKTNTSNWDFDKRCRIETKM